jgi:hypothetical protein
MLLELTHKDMSLIQGQCMTLQELSKIILNQSV